MTLGAYEAAPHLYQYALVYAEMGRHGIAPPVVDQMEVWEVAAFLGIGLPDQSDGVMGPNGMVGPGGPGDRDVMGEHVEWLLARERGEDPDPPEPDLPIRSEQEQLMRTITGKPV